MNILEANAHVVFMSATPLNNPEEISNLINIMYLSNKNI